ncbi:MAG TPA: hypothetical protein PK048_00215 [Candidatus Absconditabacterales bacterium]|nr:hypothetical protein [Candidatus Absconditabacterales bacterium]
MMLYFFYGDEFFVNLKVRHRIQEFATKHGGENIIKFDVKTRDTRSVTESIWGGGLFATKKLILIQGLPLDTTTKINESTKESLNAFYDYFTEHTNTIPDDHLMILYTTTPDKKTRWAKWCFDENNTIIKRIEHKADKQTMYEYISTQTQGVIVGDIAQTLIDSCNENMFMINNEIKKINAWLASNPSNSYDSYSLKELISQIVSSDHQIDVWTFLDGILLEGSQKSIDKLITFGKQDNNTFQFLGLLYRSIGGIINLIDCREHDITQPGELTSKTKLPPFTVSRYLSKKDTLIKKKNVFHKLYHDLVAMDYNLKKGILPPEAFWNEIVGLFTIKNR